MWFFFECVQYVSALRPPKLTQHAVNGGKTQTINNGEPVEGRRRVCSLIDKSSASAYRHDLPRRSLNDLPARRGQLSWSVEQELKKRRRLAGFDQSYGEVTKSDSDSDQESGETDEHKWKQVRIIDLYFLSLVS